MHIFFVRHGETEHNVAGLLAGVSDSRLTNHGVQQTQRLGANLVNTRGLHFTNVYSSDLQRAYMTANEICKAQNSVKKKDATQIEVVKLEVLREQDFGSLELVSWSSRRVDEAIDPRVPKPSDPNFKPKETVNAMKRRANAFLDDYIVPLFALAADEAATVAVVSHGLFLAQLWRVLLSRFPPRSMMIDSEVTDSVSGRSLESIGWSNTGYLEVDIQPAKVPPTGIQSYTKSTSATDATGTQSPVSPTGTTDATTDATTFADATVMIKAINDKRHLLNLKRARGGIGSAAYDQRQQTLNGFFKQTKFKRTKIGPKDAS